MEQAAGRINNAAATTVFFEDEDGVCFFSMQKKHHRWKLDGSQITPLLSGEVIQ